MKRYEEEKKKMLVKLKCESCSTFAEQRAIKCLSNNTTTNDAHLYTNYKTRPISLNRQCQISDLRILLWSHVFIFLFLAILVGVLLLFFLIKDIINIIRLDFFSCHQRFEHFRINGWNLQRFVSVF